MKVASTEKDALIPGSRSVTDSKQAAGSFFLRGDTYANIR